MAVIGGADYRNIAIEYAEAKQKLLDTKQDFFNAVYIIVLLQAIIPEVDLINPFWQSYLINFNLFRQSSTLMAAIRAIQSHVLREGDHSTMDEYLDAEGITVPRRWAELSAVAGFSISESKIDS